MRSLIGTACLVLVLVALMAGTGAAQTGSSGSAQTHSGNYLNAAYQRAPWMPNGTYQQSCQNIRMNGGRLEARCQKKDGGWRNTSIDSRGCRGQIVNDDGNLRCSNSGGWQGDRDRDHDRGGYWQGGMPRGTYQQTCQNVGRNGDRLMARCQRKDGGWRDTSIDFRGCRGEIVNDDGNLRCR